MSRHKQTHQDTYKHIDTYTQATKWAWIIDCRQLNGNNFLHFVNFASFYDEVLAKQRPNIEGQLTVNPI